MATAKGITRALQAMDCRAAGIAAQDLAGGLNLLKEIRGDQKLNWLSMNLVDVQTKKPIFSSLLYTKVGSTRIAILGLTDEEAGRADQHNYTILPWKNILPDILARAEKNADMIILLSSYPENINKKIAKAMPAIDLIFESGHATSNKLPQQVDNALIAHVGPRGKYVGMMRINWNPSGHWGKNTADKIEDEQQQLDRINWQIGRLERHFDKKMLNKNDRYKSLLIARKQIEQKIKTLQETPVKKTDQPCSYKNNFYALQSSLPRDEKIQAIIDQTIRAINEQNRK